MNERPKANLVRTIEYSKSTTYIFSCVDCGKEFVRSANNRRINPYCGDCQRKYDKIKNAENKAKKQAEHDKQIRADAIDELFNKKVFNNNTESLFDLSLKECANDFDYGWDRCYHDFEGIAEQLKEQKNE